MLCPIPVLTPESTMMISKHLAMLREPRGSNLIITEIAADRGLSSLVVSTLSGLFAGWDTQFAGETFHLSTC